MTDAFHPDDLRATACRLAREGALAARRLLGKVTTSRKADDTPVTEADHASQDTILTLLADLHPSHAVVAEEVDARADQQAAPATARYCWVIDPIDGTRNFARGLGVWSTSVGVLYDGRPIAGAIFDATTDQVYSASAGGGAFIGDRPMVLVDRPVDTDTTIGISSFRRRTIPPVVRGWMDRYLSRNFGSLCLHLAWVAAGLVDAAYACECKLWDITAGSLIIQEAGGVVTDHQGRSIWPLEVSRYHDEDIPILVGTKLMHARLLRALLGDMESA